MEIFKHSLVHVLTEHGAKESQLVLTINRAEERLYLLLTGFSLQTTWKHIERNLMESQNFMEVTWKLVIVP